MPSDIQDLRNYRDEINKARSEATRLGNPTLHAILTMSLLAVEKRLSELGEHARTTPQVEALKRLIGAT